MGDIGNREGRYADLRDTLFVGLGNHDQGTSVGHTDRQSERHANRQRTRREFVVSGASGPRTFCKIVIPLLLPTILATALVVFVSAVRDIPVVVLLSSPSSRPLSLLMLDYIMGAETEKATVIGVFIVLIIIVIALIVRFFGLKKHID